MHASAVYIKNEKGQLKAFIMDSEKGALKNVKLVKALELAYPEIKIISTETTLQLDYSTCGVFMLQALRYFAREGDQLFSSIDDFLHLKPAGDHFYLKPAFIPPKLLKLAQCPILGDKNLPNTIRLSQAALETIVSAKKQLTLDQYLANNTVKIDQEEHSVVALKKKYGYFDLLEKII